MKVLWLTNVVVPQIEKISGIKSSVYGGWLDAFCNDLLGQKDIELIICCPINSKKIVKGKKDNFSFYCFTSDQKKQVPQLEEIVLKENPDIIQIFGTEYIHSFNMIKICEKNEMISKVVIYIQGLVSVYHLHYTAFLPNKVINSFTFRDILKMSNIRKSQLKMKQSGFREIYTLSKANHIIGRTDWDKACTYQVNPKANYYNCNESLRDSFYHNRWESDKCEKNSVFMSQCSYPIKGFHILLEALTIVVRFLPQVKVYTTGKNLLKLSVKEKVLLTSYDKYLIQLINKNKLQNHVVFLGFLNEKQMAERFLKSNVFVSASSIENSPNSVGEAMLLGVPTISSDVGGVKNMLIHGIDGYIYQADAPYMLAHYICEIFNDNALAKQFSQNARAHALKTHHRQTNITSLLEIYQTIHQ